MPAVRRILRPFFPRRRQGTRTAALLLCLAALAARAAAAQPDVDSDLLLARWRAEAFGRERSGICCWLESGDTALRLEAAETADAAIPAEDAARRLFSWSGDGWTVVLGAEGEGTFGPWRGEWKEPSVEVAAWLRAVVQACPAHEVAVCRRELAPIRSLVRSRAGAQPASSFRTEMVRRGRGRGGSGEILTIRFLDGESGATWQPGARARITGSRRAGSLFLEILRRVEGVAAPDEAYLPLWPLEDFPVFRTIFAGTR